MGTSRRDFLKKGSLVALVAAVPLSLAEKAAGKEGTATPVALGLTKEAFKAQLNSTFLVSEGSDKVALRLVEVSELPKRGRRADKEGFSLIFRGDQETALKQKTYLFEHQELGLFSYLIVPVMSKRKNTQHYEAIINRLHP